MHRRFLVTVIVEPDDGKYHAYCPGLRGVHADGATPEEAMANARDGALGTLRTRLRHGDAIEEGPDLRIIESDLDQPSSVVHGERVVLSA